MYFLHTPRLGFRPWAQADLELAIGLWGDPEVTRLIGGPFSTGQIRERLELEIANLKTFGVQYWPIFLLSNGEHVGCCGLRPYQPDQQIYELGFHVRRAHQRQGFAREAARAVIGYAFGRLEAKALSAGHHPDNAASRRVLESFGFGYTHDEFYPPTQLRHASYLLEAEAFFRRFGKDEAGAD